MTTTNTTDRSIEILADAVMRGVAKTGVITNKSSNDEIDLAIRVMRHEVMAFITGHDKYAAERDCVLRGSLHDSYIVAAIVANSVEAIRAAA